MGRWSDAVQSVDQAQPEQTKPGRWSQSLQRREKLSREFDHPLNQEGPTRAETDLPEFGSGGLLSTEDKLQVAKLTPVFMATTNPNEIAQILSDQFPETIGIQEDFNGNIIAGNNKSGVKVMLNKPGISKLDILQGLGIMAAFTPAGRAAAIPAIAGKSAATRVGVAGAAAGATETAIQGAQALSGGTFDKGDIALSAGLGGLGEGIGMGFNRLQESRQARQLKTERGAIAEVSRDIKRAEKTTKETGIELFPAQKTLDPFAIQEQSFIADLPAAARKSRVKIKRQNKQVGNAVDNFLNKISEAKTIETAAINVRDIAEKSITDAKLARSKASGPLFDKAFDNRIIINVDDVVKDISKQIESYGPGKIQNLLNKVKASVEGSALPIAGRTNVKKLHNLKREINAQIEAFEKGGTLNEEIKRHLSKLYGGIVEKLKDKVPGYDAALKTHIEKSGAVDNLLKGKAGRLSKIKDLHLKNVVSVIFDQAETNPALLMQTKKLISDYSPESWNAIVRTEAQKRLKNIDLSIGKLTPDNAPAKIQRALFGSGEKRRIFLSALNPEQKKNALFIEDGLLRAAQGRPGGSQTGIRNIITKKIDGVGLSLRRFLKNPYDRAIATGEESAFNHNVSKMEAAMFDVTWQPQLSKIRKMKNIPASAKAMTQLLNSVEVGTRER